MIIVILCHFNINLSGLEIFIIILFTNTAAKGCEQVFMEAIYSSKHSCIFYKLFDDPLRAAPDHDNAASFPYLASGQARLTI